MDVGPEIVEVGEILDLYDAPLHEVGDICDEVEFPVVPAGLGPQAEGLLAALLHVLPVEHPLDLDTGGHVMLE